jgi:ABC-type multidrug transport system fused ATPase/permease subunit
MNSQHHKTEYTEKGHTPLVSPIPNTPMRFLWYVSKPHKKYVASGLLAVTIAEICSTSIPYVFKSIIDNAQRVGTGTSTLTNVWFWAMAYPLIVALMFLSWRIAGFIGAEWTTRTNATAYKTLFTYLMNHSHSYFSNRFAGSLSSKVTHASEGTQSLAESLLWNYFPTLLSLIFTIGYIGFSSIAAAGIFILLILVLIPVNLSLVKYRRPHIIAYAEQATRARGYAVDTITNMSAVRQFAQRNTEQERFTNHINTMRTLNIRQWRISEWILLINNVIIVAFEAIMLYIVVQLWVAKTISIGELVMIVTLIMNIQSSLVFIGSSMNGFIRRFSDIQEGLNDIIVDHEITDIESARPLIAENGLIEWKNVTFKYQSNEVFGNFNLTIRANERIGLVGTSGAGKTTFVSLLLRQHELNGGSICVDGQNIAQVTQDSLRENISVVPQEPMLFHRSIRENIMYGDPNATEAEMIAVAEKAQAHEFIMKLPEGYDTMVGERGVKLSGGQKQRVAIARAMLKDAPILVLDEATSALDSESEVAIQKALHELMEGKTVIAIAHRLSTLREMDRIIVLEDGKIIEDGTHDTLSKSGGLYARLWEHQAGGFLLD